jgi:hypothetical protein
MKKLTKKKAAKRRAPSQRELSIAEDLRALERARRLETKVRVTARQLAYLVAQVDGQLEELGERFSRRADALNVPDASAAPAVGG